MNGYVRPELLATPEWLVENLGRPGFQVIDARWRPDGTGRHLYLEGHIPSATYLDWRDDLVDQEAVDEVFFLAGPQQVTAALIRAGLGNGMIAVLYDDTAASYAARVWWTLRVYGFDSGRILNGGMRAWRDEAQPVSPALELRPPVTFTPHHDLRLQLTTAEVRSLVGASKVQILDARPPAEFLGREGQTRRLGHIPGAINVPAAVTTGPDGRFRSADDLAAFFKKCGVSRRRRIVCYDSTGLGACKLAFALCLLGYEDVGVYDGGWADWGNRLDLPAEQ